MQIPGAHPQKFQISTPMFITTLFTIATRWKQPKCPLMDEGKTRNVVYTYNGILFSLKKEGNSDIFYYTDESRGHYIRDLKQSNLQRLKVELWLLGAGGVRSFSFFGCIGSLLLCVGFSCGEQGQLFVAVCGLIALASLVVEHGLQVHRLQQLQHMGSVVVACRLQSAGSIVVAHGLSCSVACGILLDQGSNPYPLHRQVDSQPLRHQGSPKWGVFV